MFRVLMRKPEKKKHFQGLSVDGKIILKFIFKKGYGGLVAGWR